ncbi:MAG: alpha-glucosidase [Propionicimonas sp.]|nr:alpha-glucosidase [Propionicimonas sp.]
MNPWWKNAVAYHVYPRSFQDTDGDGIGDLPGILSRLDYLAELGVDLLMLGPVYPSPDDDNGYDVSDFRAIDPKYGTLDGWRELTDAAHRRGMRIMMDLVLNHTSDEHPWFRQARSGRDNPYRDFYWWRAAAEDGGPPNNWMSVFSGSAWEWDEQTQEYYLHLYSRRQPDLNWENPAVRVAVADILRFWVAEGVDAFRLDSITTISKPDGLPDAPIRVAGPWQPAHELIFNGPLLLPYLRELRQAVTASRDLLMVAEGPGVGVSEAVDYLREPDNPVDLILQWEHLDADPGSGGKWEPEWWTPETFARTMTRWQEGLAPGSWNALYLTNHDQPRPVSRFGDDGELRAQSAKALATVMYLLAGTPFIYQGEELGMTNVDFTELGEFRDIESLNHAAVLRERGMPESDIVELLRRKSRDNGRTPMQWDASPHAGFTTGVPWIGVNGNAGRINVAAESADPDSVLSWYRSLLRFRKGSDVVRRGGYELLLAGPVYAYARTSAAETLLVVANLTGSPQAIETDLLVRLDAGRCVLRNYVDVRPGDDLRPYECLVVQLTEASDHR